jgi:GNAT superfamily N-acetyltransferase
MPQIATRPYRTEDLPALVDIARRLPRAGVAPESHPRLAELVVAFFVLASLQRGAGVTSVVEVDGVVRGSCLGTPDRAQQARDCAALVEAYRDLPAELEDDPAARDLAIGLLQGPPDSADELDRLPGGLHTELDPSLQGLGVGGAVVQETVRLLSDARVAGIYLAELPAGTHQRRFYERLGFLPVAGHDDVLGLRLTAG